MPNYKIGIDLDADDNASGNIKKVSGATDGLDSAMSKSGASTGGLGGALGGLISPAGLALGAVTAIGGALVATGMHAMDLASQVESSAALMTTQLALTDEQAGVFEETMREIYRNNYGESYEDIAAALTSVEQGFARIGGLAPDELQKVTEQAIAMRDAFGMETQETVGATATLMENFGLTSGQAMDFLVAAQQKGLNSSGDLLDTIGEYSVQFGEGGATAGEFFSILEQGNAGGVLGTDKAADAFKEFGIRILDDSTTTKTALSDIGISYETLRAGFANGSITTVDAMQLVIDKIDAIEDPVERAKAGVALFGTQWEDSGEQAILSLDTTQTGIEDLEGAAESLGTQYNTTAAELEGATRLWDDALVEVGGELNGLATQVLPLLASAVTEHIVPFINELTTFIGLLKEGKGLSWDWGQGPGSLPMPWEPESALPVTPGVPITAPGASASASNYVQVYVERGDPEVVAQATELGVARAQRMRGE